MILNSGGQFEGVWIDNKKNGKGKYTSPNGEVIEGVYQDDKLVTAVARPDTPLGSAIGKHCICSACTCLLSPSPPPLSQVTLMAKKEAKRLSSSNYAYHHSIPQLT